MIREIIAQMDLQSHANRKIVSHEDTFRARLRYHFVRSQRKCTHCAQLIETASKIRTYNGQPLVNTNVSTVDRYIEIREIGVSTQKYSLAQELTYLSQVPSETTVQANTFLPSLPIYRRYVSKSIPAYLLLTDLSTYLRICSRIYGGQVHRDKYQ